MCARLQKKPPSQTNLPNYSNQQYLTESTLNPITHNHSEPPAHQPI